MEIEIWADLVCPWCYLGKVRLEAALAGYDGEAILRWRPFQLDPRLPREAVPLLGWLAEHFGGAERARQARDHVTALAAAEGLHLDYDRAVISNTFDAHRLLWYADQPEAVAFGAGPDTQPELAELLYAAHFTRGLDLADRDVLVSLADEVGLDPGRAHQLLSTTEGGADVRGLMAQAYDLGITAVPTFVLAGRYAVTGARETVVLQQFLAEVARREGMAPEVSSLIPGQRTNQPGDSRVG